MQYTFSFYRAILTSKESKFSPYLRNTIIVILKHTHTQKKKIVGCRVYGRLSHEGPRPTGGMPSVGAF